MQFNAKTKYVRHSPFKLRPLVDMIRGKSVVYALQWLATSDLKRSVPIRKIIESAAANAKQLQNIEKSDLFLQAICVDQGPMHRYFKPGAMGRSNVQRKRFSHIKLTLKPIETKEVSSGSKS